MITCVAGPVDAKLATRLGAQWDGERFVVTWVTVVVAAVVGADDGGGVAGAVVVGAVLVGAVLVGAARLVEDPGSTKVVVAEVTGLDGGVPPVVAGRGAAPLQAAKITVRAPAPIAVARRCAMAAIRDMGSGSL